MPDLPTLYFAPGTCARVALTALEEVGQPFETRLIAFMAGDHRSPDFLAINPAGKVPALVTDYCLSICSADFNEWVLKNASTRHPFSYVWTGEYEIFEFDLGHTYNYMEMAALIAPRPFMVERGHDDGVGTDEMVAYEFAKVRYLYANRLKIPDRTTIEFFVGIVEFRSMILVKRPPRVSTPNESGVTSRRTMSLTSPRMIAPWFAAPIATTSSGLIVLFGSLPKSSLTDFTTFGILV